MAYLLDTNAAIALLKENPQLLHHVRRVGRASLKRCAPVEAELWFGVAICHDHIIANRIVTILNYFICAKSVR